jgi:hypothetical protein
MRNSVKFALIAVTLAICTFSASAKKAEKEPLDPKFTSIQNISVLPVMDVRPGDKAKVNLEGLQKSVVNALKHKRYSASESDTMGTNTQIDVEDLDSADPAVIKKLGQTSDRWVMIVLLGDVHSKVTFGSTGNAEVSGYLFDKQDGSLVWKGKGTGTAGQGGLMGMAMKGMINSAALDSAVSALFATLPNLPKSK